MTEEARDDEREADRIRIAVEDIADIVDDTLDKIRLGVYDEDLHGSLKDVLETIERRLGE